MAYRHVQATPAWYLISALGLVVAVVGIMAADELGGGLWLLLAVAVLLVGVGVIGGRLTVTVDDRGVAASFGWGWPRRRVGLGEIESVVAVRNSWWHGWGIRKVRHGWMYNSAGRDAVELRLRTGKVFRIGTDEPAALLDALTTALARR